MEEGSKKDHLSLDDIVVDNNKFSKIISLS